METNTNKCLSFLLLLCKPFLLILIYMFLFTLLIVIPIICTPLIVYRFCVRICSKWLRPDLEILARGNGLMVASDQVYVENANTTVIALKLAGNLEIEKLRRRATEKMLNKKTEAGTLKYPELQQYPVKWMGYYFWKQSNFDINYHVDYYEPPEDGKFYTDEEAALVESKLVTKPHKKENSPWQIVVLPNVKSNPEDIPCSMFYFRTHHGLMDGFALCQLIVGDLGGLDISKHLGFAQSRPHWTLKIKDFFYYFVFLFVYPFDAAVDIVGPGLGAPLTNEFRREYSQLSRQQIGTTALPIPAKYLKEIRKYHNVDFGSVLISAWLGGLRRTMTNLNMKIPKIMAFGFPLAKPGHPGLLRVHAAPVTLILPVGINDPVKRLKTVDKYLKQVKKSTNTKVVFVLKPFLGAILPCMIEDPSLKLPPTGMMNVFLTTDQPFSMCGQLVTQFSFSYGQQAYGNSILFSALTYTDKVFLKTAVNQNIFSQQSDIDKLNDHILEELDYLSQQGTV